jgi:NTE family protein
VVIASDLSRGEMVRFPWDYEPRYGLDPNKRRVVDAVRASMSIPFFYEPVRLNGSYLVDGGLVSNFPVAVFDRTDGNDPRWPTFGIKLSAREDAGFVANPIRGPLSFTKAIFATAMSGHDRSHIAEPAVQRRTIFVDTFKVRATDFDIDPATQGMLYDSGRRAAEEFLKTFSFDAYVADARRRHAGLGG